MNKTVKFLSHHPRRDSDTDSFVCGFRLSVIDSQLIGTPHEFENKHKLRVILSDELLINWGLWNTDESGISDEMLKVAYQSAEEHISNLIKKQAPLEDELPTLQRTTENSPKFCPYKIVNIAYPDQNSFTVDFDERTVYFSASNPISKEGLSPEPKQKTLKAFLCHAHVDATAVYELYLYLKTKGIDVWLDKEKLLPGQDWKSEIQKAVQQADVVVVCHSKAFNQAGFRQREVKWALDAAMEIPEGEIFIVPARLEDCNVLDSLRKWHWVDLFESNGREKLLMALRARAVRVGADLKITNKETLLSRFIELGNRLRVLMISHASNRGMSSAETTDFPNVLVFLRDAEALEQEEYSEIDQLDMLYFEILHGEADHEQELTPRMISRLESIVSSYEEIENDESEYSSSIKENIESITFNSALLCEYMGLQITTWKTHAQLQEIDDRLGHVDYNDPFNNAEFARRRIAEFNKVTDLEFTEHNLELVDFFLSRPEQLPVWYVFEEIYKDSFQKEWGIYKSYFEGKTHLVFDKDNEDAYKQINEWMRNKAIRIYKVVRKNFPDVSPKMYSSTPLEF